MAHCDEHRFQRLVEHLPVVAYVEAVSPVRETLYISPRVERLLGYPVERWLEDPDFLLQVVHPLDVPWLRAARDRVEDTSRVFRVVSRDGEVRTVQSERVVVPDEDATRVFGFWLDITARADLEDRLRRSQKLETIGKVAGGIAHDFNNLLMAHQGYGGQALDHLDRGDLDAVRREVDGMIDVATRGADLARHLLGFARRQAIDSDTVELGDLLRRLDPLLRRLLPTHVSLHVGNPPAPLPLRADGAALERVLVNLVVNARDAMPDGGVIRIGASLHEDVARLTVSDTGGGMDEDTVAQIFEPFFTTKEAAGTGLGLSTVAAIVAQADGRIDVRSEPGRGTVFTVELPVTAEALAPARATGEVVLVADDEEAVAGVVESLLTAYGYEVVSAGSAEEALGKAFAQRRLDAIVVDAGLGGSTLADEIRLAHPGAAVLVMTGDAWRAVGVPLIVKPFTGTELALALQAALARSSSVRDDPRGG